MKVVIIGLGSMGKRRIRLLKVIKKDIEIIGVDNNTRRTKEISEQFGITCYSSLEDMDNIDNIECAFVCTAPLSHAEIINCCLHKNLNVFTEINLVADGYIDNIKLAKDKKKLLFLSSTPIYRDEMKKIHEIVSENKKPVSYIYHVGQYLPDWHPWESIHSFFVNDKRTNGCREILAIELPWILKTFGKVTDFHAISNKLTNLSLDYPDYYSIQFSHENGSIGTVIFDVVCRKAIRKLEIFNEDIYIEWEGMPETLRKKNMESGELECICNLAYHKEQGYSEFINEYAYINELLEFFEVLQGKRPEYSMVEDRETLELIDQIEGL